MAQKISAAKVKRQYERMKVQIEKMEENYRAAAIMYLNKQLNLAIFQLDRNESDYITFMVYPPITAEDIREVIKEKIEPPYRCSFQYINEGIIQISISKNEKEGY